MKATIKVNDGDVAIEVKIVVSADGTLAPDELHKLTATAVRKIAASFTELPYSNFGIENTTVKISE